MELVGYNTAAIGNMMNVDDYKTFHICGGQNIKYFQKKVNKP